jgi:hypothetical protein
LLFPAILALFSAPCQSASGALALRPDFTFSVMPGLVPGIHVLPPTQEKTWMTGKLGEDALHAFARP